MSDRLKQIWGGFASTTTRRLSGRDIDNVPAPQRESWKSDDVSFLPEGYNAPAQAAFDELKTRLASQEHKANKRRKGRSEKASLADAPPPPLSSDANFSDAPRGAQELIRGLKSTEDRVMRAPQSYTSFLASDAGRELDGTKKRKKFFGIF